MNPFFEPTALISQRAARFLWPHALVTFGVVLGCLALPASAQTDGTASRALVQEVERLRRDLSDIQRYVYRGDDTSPPPVPADASGGGGNARLQRQILEMQGQIREVTGHVERVQHDIRKIGERLDKLVADVDIRLRALEGGAPLTNTGQTGPLPGQTGAPRPGGETTVISSGGVSGVQAGLAPGQQSLGQISERELAAVSSGRPGAPAVVQPIAPIAKQRAPVTPPPAQAAPAPGGVSASVASVARPLDAGELPEGTPRQQYEFAFGKLKTRNYADAESALRAFVDRHPDDPLAGNAMYWMGETYYVRKQYSEAARIFLDAYQRFPKGNKAPDNLFKLAKSLVEIGENQSACTTYAELVKTFPSANQRILTGARSDMTRLGCG